MSEHMENTSYDQIIDELISRFATERHWSDMKKMFQMSQDSESESDDEEEDHTINNIFV